MRCSFLATPECRLFAAAMGAWATVLVLVGVLTGLTWSQLYLFGGVIGGWWLLRCPSVAAIMATVMLCLKIAIVSVWVQPLVGVMMGVLVGYVLQLLAMKMRVCQGDLPREPQPRRGSGSGPMPVGAGMRIRLH